jgi:hypothetical protein
MGESIEPYMPYRFRRLQNFYGDIFWRFNYHDYIGGVAGYVRSSTVRGKDELDAYIQAVKHLNQLKKRADKRRDKKKEQNSEPSQT